VISYLAIRGMLALVVGGAFGEIVPHFPPYVGEALMVELVALAFLRGAPGSERPVSFGALAGIGIGTVGLAAEWAFSHVWMVTPWPSSIFPEGAILGFVAAVAGGAIGGFIGRSLTPAAERRERIPRLALPAAVVAVVGAVAFLIPVNVGPGVRATFDLAERSSDDGKLVTGTVRLDPPDAADDALWFNVTSWQGGERARINTLDRIGPGRYRITEPIHVDGSWKTTLRLHKGRQLAGLPIFMPADSAIPVSEIPVQPRMTRSFELDHELLQREQKQGVAGWLTLAAYLGVGGISLALIGVVGWGLARLDRRGGGPPDERAEATTPPGRRPRRRGRPAPA
jgi:uncharacterized membrane protein YeaQ/YmgE (transglycosylase-associated protein family)